MSRTSQRGAFARRSLAAVIAAAATMVMFVVMLTGSASAGVYTQVQTLPVPPASSFAGSGGGDGWAITLSADKVFNVFHHNTQLTVNCNLQATATPCWSYGAETVTDGSSGFSTGMHPGASLDQATGKLYVYGTRNSDNTSGVVCFDTVLAATNPNPFCGFTALSGAGEGQVVYWGMLSAPMQVGSKVYAFNYVSGTASGGPSGTGAQNKVLCFDLATAAACAGQPYAVTLGAGTYNARYGAYAGNAGAIGSQLMIPVIMDSTERVACFDTATASSCGGSFPVDLTVEDFHGAPFPLLSAAGAITGFCLPTSGIPCYTLSGAAAATPAGITAVINPNEPWNGPGVTIGPRVYVPNGNQNGYSGAVECFDYSTSTGCANFPKTFSGLYYLYTVNSDPARPTCLWANADSGSGQIQSFDAYTGGACGSGAIRLLASQFVVPQAQCTPSTYRSLQIISPARNTYTSGSIEFDNGAGNPLGIPNGTLDATGSVDLSGLSLNTATGLPQFLVTLVGAPADTGNVVVQLTWESSFDPACIAPGTVVTKEATTITTSLSGDGKTGASIVVAPGAAVTDSATLAGVNASGATGTVTYTWYANNTCTTVASAGAAQAITTPGTLPSSAPVTLAAGTYYAIASYSGDAGNLATAGLCGAEVLKVQSPVNANSIKRDALAGLNALAAGDACKKSKGKDDKKGKDGKKGDDDDDEDCGKRFASPIKKVTKSLTAAWWLDDNHLTLNGCGVFDNEKAGVCPDFG